MRRRAKRWALLESEPKLVEVKARFDTEEVVAHAFRAQRLRPSRAKKLLPTDGDLPVAARPCGSAGGAKDPMSKMVGVLLHEDC